MSMTCAGWFITYASLECKEKEFRVVGWLLFFVGYDHSPGPRRDVKHDLVHTVSVSVSSRFNFQQNDSRGSRTQSSMEEQIRRFAVNECVNFFSHT